jgi:ParB family chromosome partitioning protein
MEKKPQLAANMFGNVSPNTPKIKDIEITHILPNPDQPRKTFDEASLRELADSIEQHGLLQPITVKRKDDDQDRYILVAGERRFRAYQLLGRTKIYGIVLTSGNIDELAIIENLQREDLSPIEEAEALAKLMDRYQYTQEVLGKVVGKAQATVSNLLNLNKLPERIKQEYSTSNNKVSKSLLMEIARHEDQSEQLLLWESIKSGGVTVRATRQAKKEKTPVRKTVTRITQTISAGKLFVHRLDMLQETYILDDTPEANEIISLRDQVNQQIGKLYSQEERIWHAVVEFKALLDSVPINFSGSDIITNDVAALRDKLIELTAGSEKAHDGE